MAAKLFAINTGRHRKTPSFDAPPPSCRIECKSAIRPHFAREARPSRYEVSMLAVGMSIYGLLLFLGIALLLFGTRLPTLARSLGQSIVEFKKGMKELEDHSDDDKKNRH